MTPERKAQIANLARYPEFFEFKNFAQEKLNEFRLTPLDRSKDIAAQAIAKEEAYQFLYDLFSDCEIFGDKASPKDSTYE